MSKLGKYIKDTVIGDYSSEMEELKKSYEELKTVIFPSKLQKTIEDRKQKILANGEHSKYMIIQLEYRWGFLSLRDKYFVYDSQKNIKYKIIGDFFFGGYRLSIYEKNNKIGRMKRNILPRFSLLDWEFKIRKTKVDIVDSQPFSTRFHRASKKWHYSIGKKLWRMTYSKKEDKYSIYYMKNVVAHIYRPFISNIERSNNLIIGYDDENFELDLFIIATCLWNAIRDNLY